MERKQPGNQGKTVSTMLTVGEVAGIFNVHASTVRRWGEQGIIKPYRIGPRGESRFRREDAAVLYLDRAIQKYLKAN